MAPTISMREMVGGLICLHHSLSSLDTIELTKAPLAICMQVIAQATFAAVAQPSIITAMAQNTDLLTTTPVCTARVRHWRGRTSQGSISISNVFLFFYFPLPSSYHFPLK